MFPVDEHYRIRDSFSQALLSGMASLDLAGERVDGSRIWMNVRLIAVHDHKMRFVGHHCLIQDRTYERDLEEQVARLEAAASPTGRILTVLDSRHAMTRG